MESTVSLRGRGYWVRTWDSRVPAMSFSRSQLRGFTGSAPAPVPPAEALPQTRPYSPRKRPVAKAAPRAAEPRASAAGTESRGMGWIMVRAGGGGVGGVGKVTCARATQTALGPLGSLAGPPCLGTAHGAAVSSSIWRLHGLTANPAQASRAPSGGRAWNFAWQGSTVWGPGSGRKFLISFFLRSTISTETPPGACVGGCVRRQCNRIVTSTK